MRYLCRLSACVACVWALQSIVAASELRGRVTDERDQPIEGATVLISTAAPRVGVSIYCPSCYADCGKKSTTDADGRFVLGDLDSTLVFNLVATAEGYRSHRSNKTDPAAEARPLKMQPLPANLAPECVVKGQVLDATGKPVVGAEVSPFGCKTKEQRWWGRMEGVDSTSITNQRGEFILTTLKPAEGFDLAVHSPRHARKLFSLVTTGDEMHRLTVENGVTIHGSLKGRDGPLMGAVVGIAQVDRRAGTYVGDYEIATRADGTFEVTSVPANDDYYLYTQMSSMRGQGALPLKRVSSGANDTELAVGDLEVGPAYPLAGRIELTDGEKIRGPIQLLLDREGAWDSQTQMVGTDGTFRFEDVPDSEPVTLSMRIPGYRLAAARNRYQQMREHSIAMFVEGPREEIVIYYEPDGSGIPK